MDHSDEAQTEEIAAKLLAYARHELDNPAVEYKSPLTRIEALIEGFRGHQVLRHALIVEALTDFIHRLTGTRITMPE